VELLDDVTSDREQLFRQSAGRFPDELFFAAVDEMVVQHRPQAIVHTLTRQLFDVLQQRMCVVLQIWLVFSIEY